MGDTTETKTTCPKGLTSAKVILNLPGSAYKPENTIPMVNRGETV